MLFVVPGLCRLDSLLRLLYVGASLARARRRAARRSSASSRRPWSLSADPAAPRTAASARSIASPTVAVAPDLRGDLQQPVGRNPCEPQGRLRLAWNGCGHRFSSGSLFRTGFGSACFVRVRAGLPDGLPLCRLRTSASVLGVACSASTFGTRLGYLELARWSASATATSRSASAVRLVALLLNLCSQVLGLDLGLDLLPLEFGSRRSRRSPSARALAAFAVRVPLSLLESSFAGELLVARWPRLPSP